MRCVFITALCTTNAQGICVQINKRNYTAKLRLVAQKNVQAVHHEQNNKHDKNNFPKDKAFVHNRTEQTSLEVKNPPSLTKLRRAIPAVFTKDYGFRNFPKHSKSFACACVTYRKVSTEHASSVPIVCRHHPAMKN